MLVIISVFSEQGVYCNIRSELEIITSDEDEHAIFVPMRPRIGDGGGIQLLGRVFAVGCGALRFGAGKCRANLFHS
jgi:hypothetical protein